MPASAAASAAALVAVLLAASGCAVERERGDRDTMPPLSTALERFRESTSNVADRDAPSLAGTARPSSDARGRVALPPAPRHPRPRPLDPVPPLYVPPPRDLALQPLLEAEIGGSADRTLTRRSPPFLDPFGDNDPLRRIDPATNRDPLGRPDPSGGVALDHLIR